MFNQLRSIRKRWFVVAASVALLSIGLVTGSVLAAGASSRAVDNVSHHGYGYDDYRAGKRGNVNHGVIMERVAAILGVEQATLQAAFATAFDEQSNTKFEEHVQALVDDETLTSDQAAVANNWFDQRPTNSGPMALRLASTSDSDRVDTVLSKLVEAERMSQDDADALSEWHGDRPDSLPSVTREHSGRHRDHYRGEEGGK